MLFVEESSRTYSRNSRSDHVFDEEDSADDIICHDIMPQSDSGAVSNVLMAYVFFSAPNSAYLIVHNPTCVKGGLITEKNVVCIDLLQHKCHRLY
jgi:hypothetical protein